MLQKKTTFLLLILGISAFLIFTSSDNPVPSPFHSKSELDAFNATRSPIDSGEYFLGSVRCQACHGSDTLHHANIDLDSNDINLYDDWQSSMMALSAMDPLWRAKVSHEILVNPGHSAELQTKCTSCHAPMGHFSAMFKGAQYYTLADLVNDTLGLNGVACGGCHEIAKDSIGSIGVEYSGNIHYDTSKVEYGPFPNPLIGPMQLYVGLLPAHSMHMSRSQVCAPCHTLLTKAADLNGNPTNTYFIEQATYHEWLNSNFNDEKPCQSCHMPQIKDPVIIANNILNLPPRSPFNLHKFMGGNAAMLKMMKQNKTSLGIDVPDANFDSTIVGTMSLLQESTLDLRLQIDSIVSDTLYLNAELTNKAGHKFPSGYPSRRAYVQFAVTSATDTLFQSGMLRPDYEITGQGAAVEPHYNVISDSTQVQIYELVMGDVDSNFTTVLERAYVELKDNRIPPAGFTSSHYAYDTIQIIGEAATDPDFNRSSGAQGSGKDIVHYHIPLHAKGGPLHISAAVYYQPLPPRWFTEMFAFSSEFIDSFKQMYQASDKAPVLVAHDQLDTTVVISGLPGITREIECSIFPVPALQGTVTIQLMNSNPLRQIEIWDTGGKKVKEYKFEENISKVNVILPGAAGIYWLKISSEGSYVVKKIIRQ